VGEQSMAMVDEPAWPERERLLAQIAVRCGLVAEPTLREALGEASGAGESTLSRTLLDRGLLTEREVALIDGLLNTPPDELRRLAARVGPAESGNETTVIASD